MNKKYLTKEQQLEIASLIEKNKVLLTVYIRKQFKDISDLDIEDCFQELFLRVYEKYSSFDRSSNKSGWLFKAMKNIMHEFCREKKKYSDHTISATLVSEFKEEFQEEPDLIFDIITNHSGEAQIIQTILSNLTEKEQLLYQLRYIKNLSTDKIAEQLSLPSGTVRRRLSDLKKKIEKLIRKYDTLQWNQNKKFSENFLKKVEHSDKK